MNDTYNPEIELEAQLLQLDGQSINQFTYNTKVMIVLIEQDYIWNKLQRSKKTEDYPKLLMSIFTHSDKKLIK